jgi:uncharacterized protein with beta-barrel porin domain
MNRTRVQKTLQLAIASIFTVASDQVLADCTFGTGSQASSGSAPSFTCTGSLSLTTSSSGINLFDVAAQYQPTGGSNSYTPSSYNLNPATLNVNISAGTTITGNKTATDGNDKGLITANYSNTENPAVNNVLLTNAGTISLTSGSVASRASVINSDSQLNQYKLINTGTITVNNQGSIGTVVSGGTTANVTSASSVFANGTLASSPSPTTVYRVAPSVTSKVNNITVKGTANAIYADDNTNYILVNNQQTGIISASGNYATGYAGRANFSLDNAGFFGNSSWVASSQAKEGLWAIATWGGAPTWGYADPASANPDSPTYLIPGTSPTTITLGSVSNVNVYQQVVLDVNDIAINNQKTGVIQGDILAIDQSIYAWGANGGNVSGIFSSSTNAGPIGSHISNLGTINGNIFWGSGNHTLINEGSLNGSIHADQSQSVASFTTTPGAYGASSGSSLSYLALFNGDRNIQISNAGQINGDLVIANAVGTQTAAGKVVAATYGQNGTGQVSSSTIAYDPIVTGSAAGSTLASPSVNIGQINGSFTVSSSSTTTLNNAFLASQVMITPEFQKPVVSGNYFKLANAVGGIFSPSSLPTIHGTTLVSWTPQINNAGNLVIQSQVQDANNIDGMGIDAAKAINAAIQGNANAGAILENMTSSDAVIRAGHQLLPTEINGGYFQAIESASDKLLDIVNSHLASSSATSKVHGDSSHVQEINWAWFQAYGTQGSQDARGGIDGFNIDSYGVAIGADRQINDQGIRLGIGGSYGQSHIQDAGVLNGNTATVKSTQGVVYAAGDFEGNYLNLTLGLGHHDIDESRSFLGLSNSGSTSVWRYSTRLEAGHPFNQNQYSIVPVASLEYDYTKVDAYHEAGNVALAINGQDYNTLRSALGLKGLWVLPTDTHLNGNLEARAVWRHDFGDEDQTSVVARFVDGTSLFTGTGSKLQRDAALIGASLRLNGGEGSFRQKLSLNYDAVLKAQYVDQEISLTARIDF